ncbi:MAG: LAGLIDADG family homing endonuclease [Candidatus Pacebacteria bacterium]|nr:LAGLIDADG family homing endonuclease [Candidatus Paceibacterota bacterium]
MSNNKLIHAYVVGVALGDGNLSNPNGRAVRLRVTCDKKYPNLITHIRDNIQNLFPDNKVSITDRVNAVDVSCYSNKLVEMLGWKVGSKHSQSASIPEWILKSEKYSRECLRGLLQTDGSIYKDRGYEMVNFTTIIKPLAENIMDIFISMGYQPQIRKVLFKGRSKYLIRVSRNVSDLISEIDLWKN